MYISFDSKTPWFVATTYSFEDSSTKITGKGILVKFLKNGKGFLAFYEFINLIVDKIGYFKV